MVVRFKLSLVAAISMVALSACVTRVSTMGNLPEAALVAEVRAGAVNRDDVRELLGSPSAVATFDQEYWYYISQRVETFAFFEPEIKERNVLIIRFDDKGVVAGVDRRTLEDGRDVEFVERETPTTGSELSVLQQLFGNIGRFPGQVGGPTGPGAP